MKIEGDTEVVAESKFDEEKRDFSAQSDSEAEGKEGDTSVVNRQCNVCGDKVEIAGHAVCFWHALTLKSDDGYALHEPEAMHSLNQYSGNVDAYLGRVGQKREDTLGSMLRGTRPIGDVRTAPSRSRAST
jgi:hypothetical protein